MAPVRRILSRIKVLWAKLTADDVGKWLEQDLLLDGPLWFNLKKIFPKASGKDLRPLRVSLLALRRKGIWHGSRKLSAVPFSSRHPSTEGTVDFFVPHATDKLMTEQAYALLRTGASMNPPYPWRIYEIEYYFGGLLCRATVGGSAGGIGGRVLAIFELYTPTGPGFVVVTSRTLIGKNEAWLPKNFIKGEQVTNVVDFRYRSYSQVQ